MLLVYVIIFPITACYIFVVLMKNKILFIYNLLAFQYFMEGFLLSILFLNKIVISF